MEIQRFTYTCVAILATLGARAQTTDIFTDITPEKVTSGTTRQTPSTWTFNDCLDWAIANSTEVRRNLLAILQADEDTGAAKDAWLPSVGFSTSHNFTNYPSPRDGSDGNIYNSAYSVNASWTVWEGNIRKYRLESARLTQRQARIAGDETLMNLKLGVLQAYLDIMYAREAVTIARQTLEVSTTQTERARRLTEAGRSSKVDLAQIESQMAQDQYNLVQAESNYASAKRKMKEILSLGFDNDMEVADVNFSDDDVNAPLPEIARTYALASEWLPTIRSNEINKDIYANDVKIAKAGNLPTIALQGGIGSGYVSGGTSWGSQMKHGLNENIGLSVSVPIYDGNATRRAVAKARLNALEYDINRSDLLDDLSQTLENLYIEAANAKAKYVSGQKQLEATQLTSTLVDRQFELGLVNPLELLTAHNNLLNARLELLQSKFMAILSNKTINFYATQNVELQ